MIALVVLALQIAIVFWLSVLLIIGLGHLPGLGLLLLRRARRHPVEAIIAIVLGTSGIVVGWQLMDLLRYLFR